MASFSNTANAALLPVWNGFLNMKEGRSGIKEAAKNLSRYISPVQLQRIKQDVRTWRESMDEAENAWYPHRVKMQQIFLDTVLNGHVEACMKRRKDMTMLKKYRMVNKKTRVENPATTALIRSQWFRNYMSYALDSKAFGYSVIYLDSIINDAFPGLSIIRRFNVSPDRMNITQFIYSLSGANFMDDPFKDWHIWVPTPTDVGVSKCGYGYLYKVAFYEIVARNVLTQNLDATEQYGMPMRVGKTSKAADSEERAIFEQALSEMGSAGYILMDAVGDAIELQESKSLGLGYKIFESLETRCEKKISKIILGHADALDSVPGKLGGDQGGNSPAQLALEDTCTVDMIDLVELTNNVAIPKWRNLGLLFPEDEEFEFDNNEEDQQTRRDEDKDNLATAQVYYQIKQAGGDPDWAYFAKRTGIPVTKAEIPASLAGIGGAGNAPDDNAPPDKQGDKPDKKKGLKPEVKAKLQKIYSEHKH